MATVILGLVCEGPTDIALLKKISLYQAKDNNVNLEIRVLSPQKDATSGQYQGGWTRIRSWCKAHSGSSGQNNNYINKMGLNVSKLSQFQATLQWKSVLKAAGISKLLIQMDTDIAEEIDDTPKSFNPKKDIRKDYCKLSINFWLGVKAVEPELLYLMTTYALETWILATYDEKDNQSVFPSRILDYETLPDWEEKLIALGLPARIKKGRLRLLKWDGYYKGAYFNRIIRNIDVVRRRCIEFVNFETMLATLISMS